MQKLNSAETRVDNAVFRFTTVMRNSKVASTMVFVSLVILLMTGFLAIALTNVTRSLYEKNEIQTTILTQELLELKNVVSSIQDVKEVLGDVGVELTMVDGEFSIDASKLNGTMSNLQDELVLQKEYGYVLNRVELPFEREWLDYLLRVSDIYNVNPHLMLAIYNAETNFRPTLIHPKSGATGLGQMKESTYRDTHYRIMGRDSAIKKEDLTNVFINIEYTTAYMGWLIDTYGIYKGIQIYSGSSSEKTRIAYMNKINDFLYISKGLTVSKMIM